MKKEIKGYYLGSAKNADSKEIAKAFKMRIEREIIKDKKQTAYARKLATAVVASLTMTGCTTFGASQMFTDSDEGFVMVAGNAEGIKAYNDGLIGIITDTKASPDIKSAYWQNREGETNVRTMRLTSKRSWSQQQKNANRY
jgi:hypothetical protein